MKTGAYQCLDCNKLADVQGEIISLEQLKWYNRPGTRKRIILPMEEIPEECLTGNHRWERVDDLLEDESHA